MYSNVCYDIFLVYVPTFKRKKTC